MKNKITKQKEKLKITVGAVIDEPGSSLKNKTGGWRSMRPAVVKGKCIGCGLCAGFCPDAAIKIINKKIVINYDYCKGCGICAVECPNKAVYMEKEKK